MPNIHAIIVTFNPEVQNVLSLISALENQVSHIWVVDNGSKNDISLISGCTENVSVLTLGHNVGIAKAQNIGIKNGMNNNADYFVFFDQDSSIGKEFISGLYIAFKKLNAERDIAAIGPVFKDTRFGFMYPQIRLNSFGTRKRIVPSPNTGPLSLSFIISSGMFTSKSVLDKVGLMNEDLFIDYVDTEWCLRARGMEYQIYANTDVCMDHAIGDNNLKFLIWKLPVHSALRRYYRMRNMYYLFGMGHVPFIMKLREFITNNIHQFLILLSSKDKLNYLKYWVKSQCDGIKYFIDMNKRKS